MNSHPCAAQVALLRLTRLADLVSEPVLAGFLDALGLLLLASQARVFDEPEAVFVAASCALIAQFLPPRNAPVPPSLVGLENPDFSSSQGQTELGSTLVP